MDYSEVFPLDQNDKRSRFDQANYLRKLFPGSYNINDRSIMLDKNIEAIDSLIVLHHEFVHSNFGQMHYGELIRRLDNLGFPLVLPLNFRRSEIIIHEYEKLYGEIKSRNEFEAKIRKEARFQDAIVAELSLNKAFMAGIRFLDKLDRLISLFSFNWYRTQEAAACWFGLKTVEAKVKEISNVENLAILERIEEFRSRLMNLPNDYGIGYRMASDVSNSWGDKLLFGSLEVCLSPDISQIDVLNLPMDRLTEVLASTRVSPDRRFQEIHRLATSTSYVPENDLSLAKKLDPENPRPILSIDEFNDYWKKIDTDPEFVSVISDLCQMDMGEIIDEVMQLPRRESNEYMQSGPYAILEKDGEIIRDATKDKDFLSWLAADKEKVIGHLVDKVQASPDAPNNEKLVWVRIFEGLGNKAKNGQTESFFEAIQRISIDKELLLQTMRREGILYERSLSLGDGGKE